MAILIPKIVYSTPEISIEFDYPPSDDFRNQNYQVDSKETVSSNGRSQTQYNYMENNFNLSFTFVSEALKNKLDWFFKSHGLRGKEFKYFEDKSLTTFKTVRLNSKSYQPEILFPTNTPNEFVYQIKINFTELIA